MEKSDEQGKIGGTKQIDDRCRVMSGSGGAAWIVADISSTLR
jgi:hypothetical protein